MSRVPPLARDDIHPDVAAQIQASFPRAGKFFAEPGGPPMPPVLGLLARHPGLAGPWLGFSGALLDGGVLDGRTRELLILATAHRTGARYIRDEHVPIAAGAGVVPAEIDAIESGGSHLWTATDAALLRAVDELVDGHRVGDATWAELAGGFDERSLLEVVFVVGTYTCLAMVLNSTDLTGDASSDLTGDLVPTPAHDPLPDGKDPA